MAFHAIEAIIGAVAIPLLVLLIPMNVGGLDLVLTIMTVMGVRNHMGWGGISQVHMAGSIGGMADNGQPPSATS